MITSPHNPTGVRSMPAALDEIGRHRRTAGRDRARGRGLQGRHRRPIRRRRPRAATSFVTTSSLTKSYGLSSLRAGWVIAGDRLTYRVRRARDVVDGTGSIVAERLAVLAFEHLDGLQARAQRILASNKALADAFLASHPQLDYVPSAATIVFPRLRGVDDATPFVERLMREHATAVGPGRFFDAPAHFRLGYGGDGEKIRAGLDRLSQLLARYPPPAAMTARRAEVQHTEGGVGRHPARRGRARARAADRRSLRRSTGTYRSACRD